MSRADETSQLLQNIVNSFEARRDYDNTRRAAVAKSKNDTIVMVAKFDADHAAMSRELHGRLAKAHKDRKAAVNTMMRNNAAVSAQCKNSWATAEETLQKKRMGHPSPAKRTAPTPPVAEATKK